MSTRGLQVLVRLMWVCACGAGSAGATAQSWQTVTNCTEADLRAALARGGTVQFDCDGEITLSNTLVIGRDTLLSGEGHQVTLSGGNRVRLIQVEGKIQLDLVKLSLGWGSSTSGAAILNNAGRVSMIDCTVVSNYCINSSGNLESYGGAVFNQGGVVNATNCLFRGNDCSGGLYYKTSGMACGGAVANYGQLSLNGCVFLENRAFDANTSANGAPGGKAFGGALYNQGLLVAEFCTFTRNTAVGGAGSIGGAGSWPVAEAGGAGGTAGGGAVFSAGDLVLNCCVLASNSVHGGNGGAGGTPEPRPPGQGYSGGAGGQGGAALGALYLEGPGQLVNSTLAWNSGIGGNGGPNGGGGPTPMPPGSGGMAAGAICDPQGLLRMTNCTVGYGSGTGGLAAWMQDGVTNGEGVSCFQAAGTLLLNCLLVSNSPGVFCAGWVRDAGHNLGSALTSALTNSTSRDGVDPKVAPLGKDGGRGWSIPLLAGSPAIDAGDPSGRLSLDQRGFPRPVGAGPDIGAYEYGYPAALRLVPSVLPGWVEVRIYTGSRQVCRVLRSASFSGWAEIAKVESGEDGIAIVLYEISSGGIVSMFRAAVQ